VVQAGDGLRLALEPLLEIAIAGDMLWQDLDGDGAVKAGVAGLVDLTHAAVAEFGGQRRRQVRDALKADAAVWTVEPGGIHRRRQITGVRFWHT